MSTLLRSARAALGARCPGLIQLTKCSLGMPQGSCYTSFRRFFPGPEDFEAWQTKAPYTIPTQETRTFNKYHIRFNPPAAALYTPRIPPVWDSEHKKPLLWDTESKKSLVEHKKILLQALKDNHADEKDWRSKITLAIAMQETEYMWGRDDSKDPPKADWGAQNFWCLNLNALMLSKVGFDAKTESQHLTQPGYLSKVVMYLFRWLNGNYKIDGQPQKTPHVASTLNFIRNGPTGYDVKNQPSTWAKNADNETVCAEYRNAIAASFKYIHEHPEMFTNDKRIGIDVPAI